MGYSIIGHKFALDARQTFKTFNPKTNHYNPTTYFSANPSEINAACELAWTAYQSYRSIENSAKQAFFKSILTHLEADKQSILEIYQKESGLPLSRGEAEFERTCNQIKSYISLLDSDYLIEREDLAEPDRHPKPKPYLTKKQIAIGPVVVFGASNFPLAYSTIGGDSISALAAGCPVIVKSHPMHTGTGFLVAKAIQKAAIETQMPNGVFSNLQGEGIALGKQLVEHPRVKAVGFTGSIKGGRAIMDLAANRPNPIPVFAEMGSINPVVRMPSAMNNQAQWSATYASAMLNSVGQFCTSPGLFIGLKTDDNYSTFKQALAQKLTATEEQCMLHPSLFKNYVSGRDFCLEKGQVLKADHTETPNHITGTLMELSVSDFISDKSLQEEVFGTFAICLTADSFEEIIQIIDQLNGQLSGTILADKSENADQIAQLVCSFENITGRVIFNDVSIGGEVCPSMHHGGPYPASSDARFTALGTDSIQRWLKSIAYQGKL